MLICLYATSVEDVSIEIGITASSGIDRLKLSSTKTTEYRPNKLLLKGLIIIGELISTIVRVYICIEIVKTESLILDYSKFKVIEYKN